MQVAHLRQLAVHTAAPAPTVTGINPVNKS